MYIYTVIFHTFVAGILIMYAIGGAFRGIRNVHEPQCLSGFYGQGSVLKMYDKGIRMENGIAIDTLHDQLLVLSRDAQYGFDRYRCDWGRANSEKYNTLRIDFGRSIRMLARKAPVKYFPGDGMFYMFNGRIYEPVQRIVLEQAYQMLLSDLYIAPVAFNATIRNENFINVIKSYNMLRPSFDIVAFDNGVVDFGSGLKNPAVMPFSPEYHVTYYHPYDFNPKARCDRWMNFLHEVLPDRTSRLILQMFLGLGLIQRGAAYNQHEGRESSKIELCLLLVGTGANGKSVVFDVACELFGREKVSKMDYAELTADGDEGMRGRYPIRNAIFNWSSDSDPKKFGRKNTGMFKRLVSGEPVPIRGIQENVLDINSIPYLIFNLNDLPLSDDASLGFIRRLQYVSFDVTIPKERQDPELACKIIKTELSGVFNWVMRGAQELRKRRYRFPAAEGSRRQMLKSLLGSQPIVAWVRAYGLRRYAEAKGEIFNWFPSTMLYESFVTFCRDNEVAEEDIPSIQYFGRAMWDKMSFDRKRAVSGKVYKVFGVTEPDLREHILIDGVVGGEEDEKEVETFIKEDD